MCWLTRPEREKTMEIIYTTACGMFHVISKNGLFFPQERHVACTQIGRIHSEQALAEVVAGGIWKVSDSGWKGFYGSCKQFGSYRGDKSFKTEKGAIAFVNRCSEDLQSA